MRNEKNTKEILVSGKVVVLDSLLENNIIIVEV